MLDLKIVGGMVADGISDKLYRADLGISGDKITSIGDLKSIEAMETIDASGCVVAPGFIDFHTHSDLSVIYDPRSCSRIHDGVTTEVVGNCGIGVAPINDDRKADLLAYLSTRMAGLIPTKLELQWNSMEEYLEVVDQHRPAVNVASLVAQGAIRINEMGFSKERPTENEMAGMQQQVVQAMKDGAFGISSGLVYMPGEYTTEEELTELATAIAPYDSFYVTHMRNEGDTIFEALQEAINIAKKAGTALHISHLKLAGLNVRGKTDQLMAAIDAAKASGLDVTFDAYPYAVGCTSLGACMPPWIFEGGMEKMLQRLADPNIRERIKREIDEGLPGWQNFIKACGYWDNIIINTVMSEKNKSYEGKSISQIAKETGKDPYELSFDTLIEENGRVQILTVGMDQKDVDVIICHPDTIVGSDGMGVATDGLLSSGKPHPRAFGTRARLLAHYVRDTKQMPIELAVKKLSSMPAKRLRLVKRGVLKVGYYADVTVFNPETVQDMATFEDPKQYSRGFKAVIVNGKITLLDDVQKDVFAGRSLKKTE